jgi:E3 ubiquitin-protein ligase RNF139
MTKSLLVSGCETSTAVLGMTSIVSYIFQYVFCFFEWILLREDVDGERTGQILAIVFYILALNSDLTGLTPEERFICLCHDFSLLFTILLYFVKVIILDPLLMSLSDSYNHSLHRYIRALAVCTFLILFPASLLAYLWSQHAISTWLLAVSALSTDVILNVVVSLMIYTLCLVAAY